MIDIITNRTDEVTFGELKRGDVFIQYGITYIKIEPNYSTDNLAECLKHKTIDNFEEIPCPLNNAVILKNGGYMYFSDTETVTPVKEATLTLEY